MELSLKKEIRNNFVEYLDKTGLSQQDFHRNTKFPVAYISDIIQEKYDKEYPKPANYYQLAELIGMKFEKAYWKHFETEIFLDIQGVFNVARTKCKFVGIDGKTGAGKTYSLEYLIKKTPNCFYIKCKPSQSRLDFLINIAEGMGEKNSPRNAYRLEKIIVNKLNRTANSVLILDECEYMGKNHFDMVKSIYDDTKGKCGIVLCGLGIKEFIEKKALSSTGHKGWQQLKRRINANWVILTEIGSAAKDWKQTVSKICESLEKGRFTDSAISWLAAETENFDDLQTYVSEILEVCDNDNISKIQKSHLNDYFQ